MNAISGAISIAISMIHSNDISIIRSLLVSMHMDAVCCNGLRSGLQSLNFLRRRRIKHEIILVRAIPNRGEIMGDWNGLRTELPGIGGGRGSRDTRAA